MSPRRLHIMLAIAAMSLGMVGEYAAAQTQDSYFSVGTFHSPKGFGLSLSKQSKPEYFTDFELIADMMDVWSGLRASTGIKGTYTHSIFLGRGVTVDKNVLANFYAGPGLTLGYARDISKGYGIIAGLSGVCGCRLTFESGIQISIDLGMDVAAFVSENSRFNNLELSLYKGGIKHFLYPQIKINHVIGK